MDFIHSFKKIVLKWRICSQNGGTCKYVQKSGKKLREKNTLDQCQERGGSFHIQIELT